MNAWPSLVNDRLFAIVLPSSVSRTSDASAMGYLVKAPCCEKPLECVVGMLERNDLRDPSSVILASSANDNHASSEVWAALTIGVSDSDEPSLELGFWVAMRTSPFSALAKRRHRRASGAPASASSSPRTWYLGLRRRPTRPSARRSSQWMLLQTSSPR